LDLADEMMSNGLGPCVESSRRQLAPELDDLVDGLLRDLVRARSRSTRPWLERGVAALLETLEEVVDLTSRDSVLARQSGWAPPF
jgi:hypothetical protein